MCFMHAASLPFFISAFDMSRCIVASFLGCFCRVIGGSCHYDKDVNNGDIGYIDDGISATTTRPAINTRVAQSISENASGVWSARVGFTLTDDTPRAGWSTPVLNRPRTTRDLTVGTSCRRS
jgi:hypothetical protein